MGTPAAACPLCGGIAMYTRCILCGDSGAVTEWDLRTYLEYRENEATDALEVLRSTRADVAQARRWLRSLQRRGETTFDRIAASIRRERDMPDGPSWGGGVDHG